MTTTAKQRRLNSLLDSLANGEAEFRIQVALDELYPVIFNESAGLVEPSNN